MTPCPRTGVKARLPQPRLLILGGISHETTACIYRRSFPNSSAKRSPATIESEGQAVGHAVNERGQSYGSNADSLGPETDPELVRVVGVSGKTGYVKREDLNVQPDFQTEEEALAWQDEHYGETFELPLCEEDGLTQIDVFVKQAPVVEPIIEAPKE